MDSDFSGGSPPRRKPKVIQPLEKTERLSIHELAAREGHDLDDLDNAAGPEADAALDFVPGPSIRDEPEPENHDSIDMGDPDKHDKKQEKRPGRRFAWLGAELSHKQRAIALIVALVLIIAAGGTVFWLNGHNQVQPLAMKSAAVKPKPKPQPIYSPLSGLPVTAAQAALPVTGVMIENSLPARPQSGLASAGVVYEAIAEAGITRFLALFQEGDPANIGPIRSARPYFVRWDLGYDAAYAHVGGSPEALSDIKAWGVKDIGQFGAGDYYHRIDSRWAPHNMYSSLSKLQQLETARGFTTSKFTSFSRKADVPTKTPTAGNITMNISSTAYNVKYVYSPATNEYERFEGGQPHVDANTNTPITPKVVVALVIPYGLEADGYHSTYANVGSGPAYIFQDGGVSQGKWEKASESAPLKLIDSSGQPIALNRGQTWLTALSNSGELSYTP